MVFAKVHWGLGFDGGVVVTVPLLFNACKKSTGCIPYR